MKIIILGLLLFAFNAALADSPISVSVSVYPRNTAPKLKQKVLKASRLEIQTIDSLELTECDCNADYMIRIDVLTNVKGLHRKYYVISMLLTTPDLLPGGGKNSEYPEVLERSFTVTDNLAEYFHYDIRRFNKRIQRNL